MEEKDSLLVIRSLEQKGQSLAVPLNGGNAVPVVLESQLHERLPSEEGQDSVLTRELRELSDRNILRRLDSTDGHVVAWMETDHYIRAVWDATATTTTTTANGMDVTQWFVQNLHHWTTPQLSQEWDFQPHWKKTNHRHLSLEMALQRLVEMGVLLPSGKSQTFRLWLPQWGKVLAAMTKAQTKALVQTKRTHAKELSVANLERMHFPGLSGSLVVHLLATRGKIRLVKRPAGCFCQLI